MTFKDKTQPNQSKGQGGPERTNPNKPTDVTPGEVQAEATADNMAHGKELDAQGKATGLMPNQKESNRMAGTTSSANSSGNRGPATGGPKASNRSE